jgi:hypothetical protein
MRSINGCEDGVENTILPDSELGRTFLRHGQHSTLRFSLWAIAMLMKNPRRSPGCGRNTERSFSD